MGVKIIFYDRERQYFRTRCNFSHNTFNPLNPEFISWYAHIALNLQQKRQITEVLECHKP